MAAGTVIYVRSGDAVFRIRNTIEETTPYVAKMTCFTVNIYRNSQHYRESDVPCRQSAVFYHQNDRPEAPGGPPASHGGENRGHAPPKQNPEHGFHSLENTKD